MDIESNSWTVAAISLGAGGFASQVASTFGDVGFGIKLLLAGGIAAIIFGMIYSMLKLILYYFYLIVTLS